MRARGASVRRGERLAVGVAAAEALDEGESAGARPRRRELSTAPPHRACQRAEHCSLPPRASLPSLLPPRH
eukprot:959828-Rhodomonas_salina.1